MAERGGNATFSLLAYGGFSFAHNHGENVAGRVSGRTGLAYGVGIEYRLLPTISLGLDILHVNKSHDILASGVITNYQLAYLNFPVMLRWRPSNNFMMEG